MNKLSLALTAIMLLALAAFMAPNIFALNRGKILRNVALWLAIFAALGLFYKIFGPGGSMTTPALSGFMRAPVSVSAPHAPADGDAGAHGFTPPKD